MRCSARDAVASANLYFCVSLPIALPTPGGLCSAPNVPFCNLLDSAHERFVRHIGVLGGVKWQCSNRRDKCAPTIAPLVECEICVACF